MSYYRKKIDLQTESNAKKVFLAEGLSEALFFCSLLAKAGRDVGECVVFCFKGIGNLRVAVEALATDSNFDQIESVGLMIDADNNFAGRLDSAKSSLHRAGIINDLSIDLSNQKIVTENGRKVGIFLSPGDGNSGAIENLILDEIRTKPEIDCLSEFSKCLDDRHGISENKKAFAQVYLSIKKPTLTGVGRGFEAGVFDSSHEVYANAAEMFLRL